MMIARLAGKDTAGDPTSLGILPDADGVTIEDTVNANLFLVMVIYGYFFISLVQLLGIFGGDRSPLQVSRIQKAFKESGRPSKNSLPFLGFSLCALWVSVLSWDWWKSGCKHS